VNLRSRQLAKIRCCVEDELNISIAASETMLKQKETDILENTNKGINQKIVEL